MTRPLHYYMLYWLLSQVSMVTGTAVVSLVQTSYIVHEDAAEAEFTVQVQRTGAAASFISAAIQVTILLCNDRIIQWNQQKPNLLMSPFTTCTG